MTAPALLTLARHGETRQNAERRWQGVSDSPLTPAGRRQALMLGLRLRAFGRHAAVYTSPLGRAAETADLIAVPLGLPAPRRVAGLREYDFGEWDGLTPAELSARGFWPAVMRDPEFAPPGGEAFGAAARRAREELRAIAARHRGERVVIVGHGLVTAATLALLLDGDARAAERYALDNGRFAILEIGSPARLVHLDPPVACQLSA